MKVDSHVVVLTFFVTQIIAGKRVKVVFKPDPLNCVVPEHLVGAAEVCFEYGTGLVRPPTDWRVDTGGIHATLSFGGKPAETFVGWGAIEQVFVEAEDIGVYGPRGQVGQTPPQKPAPAPARAEEADREADAREGDGMTWNRTTCRACSGSLRLVLDLGETPLANSLMPTRAEAQALPRYPLRLCQCRECSFVQLDVAVPSDVLFANYLYETPQAASLSAHYQRLLTETWPFPAGRTVYEMGSNNGSFLEVLRGCGPKKLLGIEPAQNFANVPDTITAYFTKDTVKDIVDAHGRCDVFFARHCMAHLDDLRGTLEAVRDVLTDDGVAVIENAYLLATVRGIQWDQLYHEHHSYFALTPMMKLCESVGLTVVDTMLSDIHGGSLVLFLKRRGALSNPYAHVRLGEMLQDEAELSDELDAFAFRAKTCIAGLREALVMLRGKTVDTYGATAKGNTLLNVLGPEALSIRHAVDSTPAKQGLFLPGTGVEVVAEGHVDSLAGDPSRWYPDVYLLTAWNYEKEILAKQEAFRKAGGKFVVPLPFPRIV